MIDWIQIPTQIPKSTICIFQPSHYYFRNVTFDYNNFKLFLDIGRYKFTLFAYDQSGPDLVSVANYSLFYDVYMKYTKFPIFGQKELH